MTKQNVIEAEPEQLLRCQQGHSRLLRSSIALALIAFDAGGDQIMRRALAALGTRENVIERQFFGMLVFTAVLAAIAVADVYPCPFHRGFTIVSADMDVMTQPDDRRNGKRGRRRMQNIIAVVFLNKNRATKPQTDGAGDTHSAERLVRKI